MMLQFQHSLLFTHIIFGLLLLKFVLCIVVQGTESTDGQRHNQIGDHFCLLNLFLKKKRKRRKMFHLRQIANLNVFKKGFRLSTKRIFMETGSVFHEPVSGLYYDKYVILRGNAMVKVISLRDERRDCRWVFLAY